jgi:hypothetical protein
VTLATWIDDGMMNYELTWPESAALEHAAGYSQGPQSDVFLTPDLKPVRDMKVIVNDIPVR